MRPSRTINIKDAMAKFRQFKGRNRHILPRLKDATILSYVKLGELFIAIPPTYWKMTQSDFLSSIRFEEATLSLTRLSDVIEQDMQALRSWVGGDPNARNPAHLPCLGPAMEKLISLNAAPDSSAGRAQLICDLSQAIMARLDQDLEIVADTDLVNGAIAKIRSKVTGRPSLPGPDGAFEAVIELIVASSKYPGKHRIKARMQSIFNKLPDKDRFGKNGELLFGDSYFEGRAAAIAAILKKHPKIKSE